jgi:ubiquinone biosynthesis monooxygenase Coq7
MIKKHRDEEDEHRETGLAYDAEHAPLYNVLSSVIKAGCKTAIWVAERA